MSVSGKTSNKGSTKSSGQTSGKNQANKTTEKTQRSGRTVPESDGDEVGIRNNVLALMETTCKTEEEVCSALHDCDNDILKACDMLLEETEQAQGQWQTNEKKKKKSTSCATTAAASGNVEKDNDEWSSEKTNGGIQNVNATSGTHMNSRENRAPSRGRSSGRPYRGRGESHGNSEDSDGISRGGGLRRGPMGRGGGRGGGRGSNRGGRGARPPRAPRLPQHSEDNWNAVPTNIDDWDNEEWTGSLADTKVFTPSSTCVIEPTPVNIEEITSTAAITVSADQTMLHNSAISSIQDINNDYSKQTANTGTEISKSPPSNLPPLLPQDPAIYAYTNSTHHMPKSQSPVAMGVTGVLSAAQSQYLSQLTQKSESLKQDRVMLTSEGYSLANYNTNYNNTAYGYNSDMKSQRKPIQRARVPPPSKIPASAVEMPGDLGSSSIGMLDVQFGALDFGSDTSSFLTDGVSNSAPSSVTNTDKYNATSSSLDHTLSDNGSSNVSSQQSVSIDSHQTPTNSMSNDVSAYSTNTSRNTQMMTDSLSAVVSEQTVTGTNTQYGASTVRTVSNVSTPLVPQLTTVAGLESRLTGKSTGMSDMSSQQSAFSTYPGQTTYGVSQSTKQTYHAHHGYPANPYSQVNSSGTSFTAASSIASANAYPPANALNQYQHVTHTQPLNTYQNSSVYGGSGLYTASGVPYNNYQTLQTNSNKVTSNVKDSQYDNAVTSANLSISQPSQSTQSTTKISSTSGKTNSSSTSSMNSGSAGASHVSAVVGQYIMSQPYYAQQPLPYGYEDVQLIPQRLAHHLPPAYFDINYGGGATGTAATGRDATLASFTGSLTAGATETRYGRAEAPSPQAVAGSTTGAATAQPPQTAMASYYYYSGNVIPGSFPPYGTQPIYPIATAGGTGSSSYGAGKSVAGATAYVGGGVVGAYGAPAPTAAPPPQTYDTAQQPNQQMNSHQDYKPGGAYSSQQSSGVKSGVNNSNSGSGDLNNTIYGGKSHVSLGKVNSYDKAYHSATPPPPYGLGAAAGVAGVGAGGYATPLYIPHTAMPPPPQQHQMDGRMNSNHRRDNGTNSTRGNTTGQNKQGGGAKQGYSPSYWTTN